MAIDNNSTVAISIVVKDDGSIALIDAAEGKLVKLQNVSVGAGSAVGKVASGFGMAGANLGTFGTSLSTTTQQMTGFSSAALTGAAAAESAGARTADSFHAAGGAVQGVRLAVQELGLRVPRAMESIIAHNAALAGALRVTMGLFVGIGAIEIGAQMIQGLVELYDKWFDINRAVDEYREKAEGASEQKLFNNASIETTAYLLKQVGAELDQLDAKRNSPASMVPWAIPVGALKQGLGFHSDAFTTGDATEQATKLQQQASLQDRQMTQQHERALQQIEDQEKFSSTAVQGYGKIAAAQQASNDKAAENFRFTQQTETALHDIAQKYHDIQESRVKAGTLSPDEVVAVPHIDPNAGWQQYIDQRTAAAREAQAQTIALSRTERDQVIQMQNAAIDAGVRGEALYDEQRQQAIDAVARKFQQSELSKQGAEKETAAIDMKFHNEKMQRLQDEQYATLKIQQEAQQAGLTGVPKIQAETQSKITDLTQNPANVGLSADDVQKRRVAYEQQGNQQIEAARDEFTRKIQAIEEHSNDQMLSGLARIAAQEKQSLTELAKNYDEFYGSDQSKWQGYQSAKTAVEQNADRERQQYSRQVNEQISQTEAQAARLVLPPWQAAQQQILDEYAQRLAKVRTEVQQHVITEEQGAREVNAAWQLANAQMQRQAEQSRDQIAGQLEQLFSDPSKYMQNRAKQMMMDIIANWVQQLEQANPRMQGFMGGLLGQNKMPVGSPRTALAGLFGGGHGESLGMPEGQLASAGSTLSSAGMTLSSSGTMLMNAAQQISMAASQMGGANPLARGGFGGLGGTGSGWTGLQSGGSMDMPSYWGSGGSSDIGTAGMGGGGMSGAFSMANTATGAAAAIGGASSATSAIGTGVNTIQQMMQISSLVRGAAAPAGSPLNPSGGMQPTDLPPTSTSGVPGTVPNSPTGAGATDAGAGTQAVGGALTAITGGMALYGSLKSSFDAPTFASGLAGAGMTALTGAELGFTFGGPLGAGIGAAAGFAAGIVMDLFGDHGRSKAKKYNINQIIPQLQQAMDGFSFGGSSYDSATAGINSLQGQAQQQTKQWGSGAWDYYKQVMIPEFQNAQQQVDREGAAGRSNVKMSAAQFDSGGVITSFGDMATGPFSGFIHARMGERVMNPMASMTHASTLDAMNSGTAALSALRHRAPLGGGAGGGEQHLHVHLHTLDVKDFQGYLRRGGGSEIQTYLNQAAGRYAGRGLNAT